MSHAQGHLDLSVPSPKLATVTSRRLMPCSLSQRAPLVFHFPTVNALQIKSPKLHAVKYLPIPFH